MEDVQRILIVMKKYIYSLIMKSLWESLKWNLNKIFFVQYILLHRKIIHTLIYICMLFVMAIAYNACRVNTVTIENTVQ